jgi:predicted ATPase
MNRDLEASKRHCVELVAYCAEKKVEQWRLLTAVCHALAGATLLPTAANIEAARAALSAKNRTGIHMSDSVFAALLAETLLATGDFAGAETTLRETFAFVEESGERFWLAELHRLDGQIALKQPQQDQERAANCFLQAIEIARGQGALMLQLRAATDLAQLWRETGSGGDPRALLEPILAATEGGKTTSDVGNARALLAGIG